MPTLAELDYGSSWGASANSVILQHTAKLVNRNKNRLHMEIVEATDCREPGVGRGDDFGGVPRCSRLGNLGKRIRISSANAGISGAGH